MLLGIGVALQVVTIYFLGWIISGVIVIAYQIWCAFDAHKIAKGLDRVTN